MTTITRAHREAAIHAYRGPGHILMPIEKEWLANPDDENLRWSIVFHQFRWIAQAIANAGKLAAALESVPDESLQKLMQTLKELPGAETFRMALSEAVLRWKCRTDARCGYLRDWPELTPIQDEDAK